MQGIDTNGAQTSVEADMVKIEYIVEINRRRTTDELAQTSGAKLKIDNLKGFARKFADTFKKLNASYKTNFLTL